MNQRFFRKVINSKNPDPYRDSDELMEQIANHESGVTYEIKDTELEEEEKKTDELLFLEASTSSSDETVSGNIYCIKENNN